jgi:hypothetical protein
LEAARAEVSCASSGGMLFSFCSEGSVRHFAVQASCLILYYPVSEALLRLVVVLEAGCDTPPMVRAELCSELRYLCPWNHRGKNGRRRAVAVANLDRSVLAGCGEAASHLLH